MSFCSNYSCERVSSESCVTRASYKLTEVAWRIDDMHTLNREAQTHPTRANVHAAIDVEHNGKKHRTC